MKHGFGDRIRSEMNAQGFTDELMADALGATKKTFNNWTTERSEPSFRHLCDISEILQVNLHWVLTGNGPIDLPEQTRARDQLHAEIRKINERRIARIDIERKRAKLAREIECFNKSAPTEEQVSQEVKA